MILILFMIVIFSLGLIKRNSKFIFFLQMFSIWLFMGWNNGGMDYGGNEEIFYTAQWNGFRGITGGWLSDLISVSFRAMGLDFMQYNIFTTLVALIVIGYVVLRETEYPCMFAELFLIYPFIESIIQKRFFLGMAFVFLGLYFLRKNKKILFLISMIGALGFHFSFVFYLPLFFWRQMKRSTENCLVAFLVLTEVLVLWLGVPLIGQFVPESKIIRYLTAGTYSSWIVAFCFFAAQLLYIFLYYHVFLRTNELTPSSGKSQNDIPRFTFSLNKLAMILCPLCMFESVFMRYYRVVVLYEYIVLTNAWGNYRISKKMKIKKRNKWLYILPAYLLIVNTVIYMMSKSGLYGYINTLFSNQFMQIFR